MANEAFSLKSASVRWAGWATVTYGRVGKLKTRVGKRKIFFWRFAPHFAHPGLKPCRRPCYTVTLKPGLWVTQWHRKFGTDTFRSATYDFLLTIHSSHGPISYRFRDRRRFPSKTANFSHSPRVFCAPLKGFPWELGIGARGLKLESWGYRAEKKKFNDIFSRLDTNTNVSDRRTDTYRTTAKTALTRSVAR